MEIQQALYFKSEIEQSFLIGEEVEAGNYSDSSDSTSDTASSTDSDTCMPLILAEYIRTYKLLSEMQFLWFAKLRNHSITATMKALKYKMLGANSAY